MIVRISKSHLGKGKSREFLFRGQLNKRVDGARVKQSNYQIRWGWGSERKQTGVAEHCPQPLLSRRD